MQIVKPKTKDINAGDQNLHKENIEKRIVDRIFQAVIEQRLLPNTKLSESKLCETFGVGRMHVRRALLLLSSQGIINLQSNRGAFVASPDQNQSNEVFEARLLIEPTLIRTLTASIQALQLDDISHHIHQEDLARQNNDRTNLIRLSGEFHVKLAEASGNTIITKTVRQLVTKTSLIIGIYGSSSHAYCADGAHQQLLDAIKKRKPDQAAEIMTCLLKQIWAQINIDTHYAKSETLDDILGGSLS